MFSSKTNRAAAPLTPTLFMAGGQSPTLFMAGGQFSSTYILVLYLCRQIMVAYKFNCYCYKNRYKIGIKCITTENVKY